MKHMKFSNDLRILANISPSCLRNKADKKSHLEIEQIKVFFLLLYFQV